MAIITVSRELATLGDETAQEVAKSLDYRFVNRAALEERIKSYGFEGKVFKKYDERKPSFLASMSQDRDDYLHYLKTAIFAEAEQGNCVFIGRGANIVFKDMPGVLSVFLVAPMAIRVERVKNYFHCDEKRAGQIIERNDHDRVGFHRYFFHMDWKDPGYYHLSLNTGVFNPSICAEMIRRMRDHIFTPELEAQGAIRLKELILEQQVKHHIIYKREIPVHFLETPVSGDTITLHGVAHSQPVIDAALEATQEVTGSVTVPSDETSTPVILNEIQIVREYSMIS